MINVLSRVYSYSEELRQEKTHKIFKNGFVGSYTGSERGKMKVSVAPTKFNIPQSALYDHVKEDKKLVLELLLFLATW